MFGTLQVTGKLNALTGLKADDGMPAFFTSYQGQKLALEHEVTVLNEARPTSLDAWITGKTRVAVEVKFTEQAFGTCSRPALQPTSEDYCSGAYSVQLGRGSRCSLTERGIRYWEILPNLFAWNPNRSHEPCPLNATYQLVRNALAACVTADGMDIENAHALVVFDARNPSFQPGGRPTGSGARRSMRLRFNSCCVAYLGRHCSSTWHMTTTSARSSAR